MKSFFNLSLKVMRFCIKNADKSSIIMIWGLFFCFVFLAAVYLFTTVHNMSLKYTLENTLHISNKSVIHRYTQNPQWILQGNIALAKAKSATRATVEQHLFFSPWHLYRQTIECTPPSISCTKIRFHDNTGLQTRLPVKVADTRWAIITPPPPISTLFPLLLVWHFCLLLRRLLLLQLISVFLRFEFYFLSFPFFYSYLFPKAAPLG